MSPDRIRFTEIIQSKMPMVSTAAAEETADELIAAGATLTETAEWKIPRDSTRGWPYCTRCGEESLFDGWGLPKFSARCPNCGAIMTNTRCATALQKPTV